MKAIITDLDRTLLHTDKSVSDETVRVLTACKEMGIFVGVATARPERAITQYQNKIGFDMLVTLNGAKAYTDSMKLDCSIPMESIIKMLKKLENIEGTVISLETNEGIFSNVDIPLWEPTVFDKLSEAPLPDKFYKVLVSSDNVNLNDYINDILEKDTYVSVAEGVLFQIMSNKATKWNGIKKVLESLDISPEETIYFGDDNDDIEPIKKCGMGVAVSNAIESVKDVADIIIKSNDEDGVAEFLKENILKK